MDKSEKFYTLKGYQAHDRGGLTTAMEDYLEMIGRLLRTAPVVRIGTLAEHLHVRPSSASKMIQHLKNTGYVNFKKYGDISLTEQGRVEADYLLYRHKVLERFLCALNRSDDELEQVEKIEHFLNRTTIANLDALTEALKYKK